MKRLPYFGRVFQDDLRKLIEEEHANADRSNWICLQLERLEVVEEYASKGVSVSVLATVVRTDTDSKVMVDCSSVEGPVDAFYRGLVNALKTSHPSLEGISFTSFSANAKIDAGRSSTSGSLVHAMVGVSNNRKQELVFEVDDTSILGASVGAVLYAVEFYVNAEVCYRRLQEVYGRLERQSNHTKMSSISERMSNIVCVANYQMLASPRR